MECPPLTLDEQNFYCENSYIFKSNLHIHFDFYQNSKKIIPMNGKKFLKFMNNLAEKAMLNVS